MKMKYVETAAAGLWDSTAVRIHRAPGFRRRPDELGEEIGRRVTQRYEDQTTLKRLFSGPPPIEVKCGRAKVAFAAPRVLENIFDDLGGMKCGTGIARGGGAPTLQAAPIHEGRIRIFEQGFALGFCGVGRRTSATASDNCSQTFATMLGDWSISGTADEPESKDCNLLDCKNVPFKAAAEGVFKNHLTQNGAMGSGGATFAQSLTGIPAPYTENTFFLSYVGGEEGDFVQKLPGAFGSEDWPTTPGGRNSLEPEYRGLRDERGECFLGVCP
jgi:hypothetical protein